MDSFTFARYRFQAVLYIKVFSDCIDHLEIELLKVVLSGLFKSEVCTTWRGKGAKKMNCHLIFFGSSLEIVSGRLQEMQNIKIV